MPRTARSGIRPSVFSVETPSVGVVHFKRFAAYAASYSSALQSASHRMHPGALKALEFDRIVAVVRDLALTPLGASRLEQLCPTADVRQVEHQLALTTECVGYLREHGDLPLTGPDDLDSSLMSLAVEGRALEPQRLLGLADYLMSLDASRAAIRGTEREAFPRLRALVDAGSSFAKEAADIRAKIVAPGEVVDDASPQLRVLRDRLRRQRNRLRTTLESYLRGRDTAKYLQEQIVTDRNGRYVLVVRTEHRTAIPGIVHGTSASGASLFLEPLSTVEVNNDVVALEEQVAEEVFRILLALSNAFRKRAIDLQRALKMGTELDVVQAKARFSVLVDGVQPELSSDGRLELPGARHPLLIPQVARSLARTETSAQDQKTAVPVDILITPPATALVVTGPNTGGKTVALKTAGLLVMMAQAGLRIPAAVGARMPIFRSVFADIGDEQSIAANLSTFSWHMTNIASMDRELALPSLVLLDEVGAGTDPNEGGALGVAIIEHFRRRGALVIATTHYDALKTYAATASGVAVAAFGFEEQTCAPTYRLVYGSSGRSLALEIAGRLGLPPSIIEAARASRDSRELRLEEHLKRVEQNLSTLEVERAEVARSQERLMSAESRLSVREEEVRTRERAAKRELQRQVEECLRRAQGEVDGIVDQVKDRGRVLAAAAARRVAEQRPALSTGETGELRATARRALEAVGRQLEDLAAGEAPPRQTQTSHGAAVPSLLTAGERVTVRSLGIEGVVRLVSGPEVEVEVRGKRLRLSLGELESLGSTTAEASSVSVSVQLQPREDVQSDLNLIGCRVDEALSRAERFIDDAIIAEQNIVRVIHGFGTGQLRRAIAGFLSDHPLVARFQAAPADQGGGGVTVVELKD